MMVEPIDDDELARITEDAVASNTAPDLSYRDLSNRNLRKLELAGANFRGSNLYKAKLNMQYLDDTDFRGANLESANLYGANLFRSRMDQAYCRYTSMQKTDLSYTCLQDADLNQARICQAYLYRTDCRGADMSDPYFFSNRLWMPDMRGVKIPDNVLNILYSKHHIVPDTGEFTGWTALAGYLIHVLIPEDAERVGGLSGTACRASSLHVISITGPDGQQTEDALPNGADEAFQKGKTIVSKDFDANPIREHGKGLHFVRFRGDAEREAGHRRGCGKLPYERPRV